MENISIDVEELHGLDRIEQAQRFEEAHRRIDDIQRIALNFMTKQGKGSYEIFKKEIIVFKKT